MASTTYQDIKQPSALSGTWAAVRKILGDVAQTFMISREYQVRADRIAYLQRLSDADLAKRGIERDRIVHHVYADLLGS